MINVYSDANQSASKYLKNTEANIHNVLVMTGDFNIRDSNWNPLYSFHSVHSDLLVDIADAFDLSFSHPTNQVSTRYLDNANNSNSVINLIFLRSNLLEFDNYSIFPDLQYSSDHTLFIVDIFIIKEFVQDKRCIIIKNSKEKEKFTSKLMKTIKKINISQLVDKNSLKLAV